MDLVQKLDVLLAAKKATPISFRRVVLAFYAQHGRSFPWRETSDPYAILVSEVMLQQTQTDRVVEKYREFLKAFPGWRSLSQASVGDVISVWQGLGYYRRALNLRRTAQIVCDEYREILPRDVATLQTLPGIGAYTAAAVAAFAFRAAEPMIETNIRALYLYTFFPRRKKVTDREILEVIEETIDKRDPRRWFYALMDCGVELKRHRKGVHLRSKHHVKQARFEGSFRQVRAAVLRLVTSKSMLTKARIQSELPFESEQLNRALSELEREGFVQCKGGRYALR